MGEFLSFMSESSVSMGEFWLFMGGFCVSLGGFKKKLVPLIIGVDLQEWNYHLGPQL